MKILKDIGMVLLILVGLGLAVAIGLVALVAQCGDNILTC